MSVRHGASRTPRSLVSSGPIGSATSVLKPARQFIQRFAIAYGALFLLWLTLRNGLVRLLAAGADRVVELVEHPAIITALVPHGHSISVHSYLRGTGLPLAAWNGADLHLFGVVPLALILAIPRGPWVARIRRTALAAIPLSFVMIAVVVVQVRRVAEAYAREFLGVKIYSGQELAFLERADKALFVVGMLLVPAFLFLVAFVSMMPTDAGPVPARRTPSFRATRTIVLVAGATCVAVWIWLMQPRTKVGTEGETAGIHQILALNPDSGKAYYIAGFHEEELGRLDEARQFYARAVALESDSVDAYFGLGDVQMRMADYDGAVRSYEEVLKRSPQHSRARVNLGIILAEKKLYGPSIEAFRQALEIEPNYALAHRNLGLVLLRQNRPCEAWRHLEKATLLDRTYFGDATLNGTIARLRTLCVAGGGAASASEAESIRTD
jgi:tetratricopeptide (TPR) repeat protein